MKDRGSVMWSKLSTMSAQPMTEHEVHIWEGVFSTVYTHQYSVQCAIYRADKAIIDLREAEDKVDEPSTEA
jgi:hypothetical protein